MGWRPVTRAFLLGALLGAALSPLLLVALYIALHRSTNYGNH